MNYTYGALAVIAVMLVAVIGGCSNNAKTDKNQDSGDLTASRGEHDRDGHEHGEEGHAEHAHGGGEHGEEGHGEHAHDSGEHGEKGHGEHGHGGGEHGEEGHGEHHGEECEESGVELALNERYDEVRNGARLILAYDAQSNSFNGTVENTTDKTLERVRVEVHLSNGKELGTTTPADLAPGEKRDVKLTATSKDFDGWNAHPEVGSDEHGHGEGHGEHGREGGSEHK